VLDFDWCGEFYAMTAIIVEPQPVLTSIPVQTQPQAPLMEQLEEGVAPKIRFQKVKRQENIKELQDSPLFQS
jgi:hypothetical protein